MPEVTTDFESLPEEYQHIIHLAQDNYNITVAPLQLLVGGWSGAVVYLVSVSSNEIRRGGRYAMVFLYTIQIVPLHHISVSKAKTLNESR